MWVANSIWVVPTAAAAFLFLLFPTGQLRSPRWRPAAWFVSGVFALVLASAVVSATRIWSHPFVSFNQAQGGPVLRLELLLVPIAFLVSVAAATVRFALVSTRLTAARSAQGPGQGDQVQRGQRPGRRRSHQVAAVS